MRAINTTTATTITRTNAVNAFLADAKRYEVLKEEEIVALIARAKEGDTAAQNKIINHNLRFIFSLCSKFADGDKITELCSVATIGMINAIYSFDATLGFKFLSYAVHYMRLEISEYFRDIEPMIKKSNAAKIGSKAKKISEKFYQSEMRYPTEEELIDMLESEYNIQIKDRRDLLNVNMSSLSQKIDDSEEATAEEIGEIAVVTASTNEFVNVAEREQSKRAVSLFLSNLAPRESNIIKMSFGMDEWENNAQTDESIADRYGLTAERVRQIRETTIKRMRERKERIMARV